MDVIPDAERRPGPERRPSEHQTAGTRSWRPPATGLVNVRRSSGERYIERRPSSYGAPRTGASESRARHHPSRPSPPPPQYSFLPPPPRGGRPPSPVRRGNHEPVYYSESRPSSPVVRAVSTADDLFRFFESLAPPVHLQHQPKEAVVWHWTSWLIRVRGVDDDDARTMAEVYVDERWKGHEEIPRRDHPTYQQPTRQDSDSPWTRWEHDSGSMRSFPRDVEEQHASTHNDTGRPQVRLSTRQLRDMQTSRTWDTPSPSPAGHRRVSSAPTFEAPFPLDTSQNPYTTFDDPAPTREAEPTHWEQRTYLPESLSFAHQTSLQDHLTNAVGAALATARNHNPAGQYLYLDARFRIPMPVARAMADGVRYVDLAGSLSDVRTFVPVVGERGGERQERRTFKTAEELAQEEAEGWDQVRVPKRWSY